MRRMYGRRMYGGRGFLLLWYARYGLRNLSPNPDSLDVWHRFVVTALAALRFHNPGAQIALLDLDNQLRYPLYVRAQLGILDPSDWYRSLNLRWERQWVDKATALEHSPFSVTCLLDVDVLVTEPIHRIFDSVDDPGTLEMAALAYPNYQNTETRLNTGVWVAREGADWWSYWNERGFLGEGKRHNDEAILDRCVSRKVMRVGPLPGEAIAADPHIWLNREVAGLQSGPFHDWNGPLIVEGGISGVPRFRTTIHDPCQRPEDGRIAGFHLSSCKTRIDSDPLMAEYRSALCRELGMPGLIE